ncbi:PAS domain S-box protein, partial [bacterium]|nr:PAS domain S-box protein [bacterium]
MRKFTINVIALNILFVVGATVISLLLFLTAIRDESERLAKVEQEQGIQTFWKLLRAKGTDFRVVDGKLMADDYVLNGNFELPDTIQSIFGSTATVFMGDTRISTNVRRKDGSRAMGMKLVGPAHDAIFRQNRPYRGEAMILGVPYFTAYDPIKNSRGEIIGALYVGARKSEFYSRYEHYKFNVIASVAIISAIFTTLGFVVLRDRKCHLEALQDNEAKYRTLFESSAEGILLLDDIIFDCNEQLCRLFGSNRGEVIGCSPLDFSPELQPDGTPSSERARQLIDAALAGEPHVFPWQHLRQDGTTIDTEVSLKALSIQGRTVLQGVVRDVTELKKADARMEAIALALSEASGEGFLHSLVEHLATILKIDYAFIAEFCDDERTRARTVAGFGLGEHLDSIEYDLMGTPCANAANGFQCHYPEKVALLFPDDHLLTAMGAESYLGVPLRSADGTVIGIMAILGTKPLPSLGTVESVFSIFAVRAAGELERQRAEESLRTIRLQQQAMLDNIPDIVWLKDTESRYIAANVAFGEACGISPLNLVGKNDLDVWPADLAALYRNDDAQVMRSGKQFLTEEPLVDVHGKRTWIETIKMPIFNEAGAVIGTTGIARDITARREAELTLRENQARLAKAQRIAHVGNWDWDIINNTVLWSDEIFRIFRIPPDQLDMTYEIFLSAVHPDDRQAVVDAVDAALYKGTPYEITHRIICPDGEIRHVREQGEVEFDTDGTPVRMQGVVKDITESTLAEAALRESEARFREIFEQNEDAIILMARDSLDIIDANRATETLIGRDKESLNWLGPWSFIVPDDYNAFIGSIPPSGDTTPFHLDRIGVVRSDGT